MTARRTLRYLVGVAITATCLAYGYDQGFDVWTIAGAALGAGIAFGMEIYEGLRIGRDGASVDSEDCKHD